jgi:hypothetical protein
VNPIGIRATQSGNVVSISFSRTPFVGTLFADGSIVANFSPSDPSSIKRRFNDGGFGGVREDECRVLVGHRGCL